MVAGAHFFCRRSMSCSLETRVRSRLSSTTLQRVVAHFVFHLCMQLHPFSNFLSCSVLGSPPDLNGKVMVCSRRYTWRVTFQYRLHIISYHRRGLGTFRPRRPDPCLTLALVSYRLLRCGRTRDCQHFRL